MHDGQKTTISNDGATIMKLLDLVHPAAKALVDISMAQVAYFLVQVIATFYLVIIPMTLHITSLISSRVNNWTFLFEWTHYDLIA